MASYQSDETVADESVMNRVPLIWRLLGGVVVVLILLIASFELVYAGKVFPGVSADGVYIGGASRTAATSQLTDHTKDFLGHAIPITYGDTTLRIPVNTLGITYNVDDSVVAAYGYGRRGGFIQQASERLGSLFGRSTSFDNYSYDNAKLTPYLSDISDDVSTPVANASLDYADSQVRVTDSSDGSRLDIGQLLAKIDDHLRTTNIDALAAPTYKLPATISSDELKKTAEQAQTYLSAPLQLSYGSSSREVTQQTIASWINVSQKPQRDFLTTKRLEDLYPTPSDL